MTRNEVLLEALSFNENLRKDFDAINILYKSEEVYFYEKFREPELFIREERTYLSFFYLFKKILVLSRWGNTFSLCHRDLDNVFYKIYYKEKLSYQKIRLLIFMIIKAIEINYAK